MRLCQNWRLRIPVKQCCPTTATLGVTSQKTIILVYSGFLYLFLQIQKCYLEMGHNCFLPKPFGHTAIPLNAKEICS